MRIASTLISIGLVVVAAASDLRYGPVYSSHMVLQRSPARPRCFAGLSALARFPSSIRALHTSYRTITPERTYLPVAVFNVASCFSLPWGAVHST